MDTEPWLVTYSPSSVPFSVQLDGSIPAAVFLRRAGGVSALTCALPSTLSERGEQGLRHHIAGDLSVVARSSVAQRCAGGRTIWNQQMAFSGCVKWD